MFKYGRYLIFFTMMILAACSGSRKTSVPRNLRMIYHPGSSSLHPELKVYNTSDTSSMLLVKIFTRELLYNLANAENQLSSQAEVFYSLYDFNEDKEKELVDSATTAFKLDKNPAIHYHLLKIEVPAKAGKKYMLEVITTDLNRHTNQYSFLKIDRKNEPAIQDFLVYNKQNNKLVTEPFINESIPLKINHYQHDFDSLYVYYFPSAKDVPPLPEVKDTILNYYSGYDTTWVCYLDSITYSNFSRKGMYYFTSQTKPEGGFALFNFGKNFPVIRTPDELLAPLAYLHTIDSVAKTDTTGKYTKLYVDNFWLKRAKNMERSRELIKLFYNRVFFANFYFTSHVEGWRTGRGMIYIIYGLPDHIYKTGEEERWIYHHDPMGPGITFYFSYQQNPYSLNHFILEREKIKYSDWDTFIELWNSGEIFYNSDEVYRTR
ncbi:MAG TPA: GWxTD domain-containing protein [Bacteroidales bacterium]|nr:GWxTD domain-containing protein [Bacteroidales bacterium]